MAKGGFGGRVCALLLLGAFAMEAGAHTERIYATMGLHEALAPIEAPSAESWQALVSLEADLRHLDPPRRIQAIEAFVRMHPTSPYRAALIANSGFAYLDEGYTSRAIDSFRAAWQMGRESSVPQTAALMERVAGELTALLAKLGRVDQAQALLSELTARPLRGTATEQIAAARESLEELRQTPALAMRCGVMALSAVIGSQSPSSPAAKDLMNVTASARGLSLADLQRLSVSVDFPMHPVKANDQMRELPVPAIVHYGTNHFAAITARRDDRYLVVDPVLGGQRWLTGDAIRAETTGYFLVANNASAPGWTTVAEHIAAGIYGGGDTTSSNPDMTSPDDDKDCDKPCGSGKGMPSIAVHSMLVSLNLVDTPASYTPPKGPVMDFTLTYNQREADQPANFTYFNLGRKWNFNWLSFIQDDPTSVGNNVSRYVAGGGWRRYVGYNGTSGAFTPDKRNGSQLVRVSATSYELRMADGSKEVYSFSDGGTSFPRRLFLTARVDEAGNQVTLQYDAQCRLTRITDALAQATTLQYTNANPLLITGITDPFGRKATIGYDTSGRLSSITDAVNLTTSFTYDTVTTTFIKTMVTPYGTTIFSFADGLPDQQRWLEIVDPLGNRSRVEYRHGGGVPFSESAPQGIVTHEWLNYRNTFYWDQTAMAVAPGDYSKARIKHWLHQNDNSSQTYGVLESIKYPLENRIWYNYPNPGIYGSASAGSFDQPTAIAQIQADGSTRLETIEYNPIGKVTRYVNPLGHELVYEYDANQIDLLRIKRRRVSTDALETFAQYTYNAQHRVLTYTDAAGGIWRYTYNAAGQIASEITPANETTSYTYDAKGYLTAVVNPRTQTAVTYTYDAVGRVNKRTDSQGAVQYAYDNLDRLVTTTYPDLTTETNTYNRLDIASSKDRAGQVTIYTYDAVRNLVSKSLPAPDPVPTGGTGVIRPVVRPLITYTYFENRLPKSVKDTAGAVTTWTRDIQGRVLTEASADRGTTTYAYDVVGNLATQTDARGKTTTYTYDKLRRVTKERYADATESNFAYDGTTNGELGKLTAASGVGTFKYDARGLLIEQTTGDGSVINPLTPSVTVVNGVPTISWRRPVRRPVVGGWPLVRYGYTAAGRRASMTYPSGKVVTYTYTGGVVTNVAVNGTSILRNITYTPLGAITGGTWGSNVLFRRTYDQNYRISNYDLNVSPRSLAYDANGNLTSLTDSLSPALNATYRYDFLNRLTQELRNNTGSTVDLGFTYDSNDNRLTSRTGTTTYSLAYTTGASRLLSETGPTARTYTYDAAGNIASDGQLSYAYDGRGRLITAHKLPVTAAGVSAWSSYTYNAFGQMRSRNGTSDSSVRDFVYDPDGKLIGDYLGSNQQETVWLGDMPIALLTGTSTIQYIHADHLNTPRAISGTTGAVLWRWDSDAFGNGLPNEDVDGDGVKVTYNLRFPGQYYDGSTGKHYNYFRDYDPVTGRYLQSDPIGIAGGLNTYLYADANPLRNTDPTGEKVGGTRGRDSIAALLRAPSKAADPSFFPEPPTNKDGKDSACVASDEAECDMQLERDIFECKMVGLASCYAQANQRYAACLAGNPIPPLVY